MGEKDDRTHDPYTSRTERRTTQIFKACGRLVNSQQEKESTQKHSAGEHQHHGRLSVTVSPTRTRNYPMLVSINAAADIMTASITRRQAAFEESEDGGRCKPMTTYEFELHFSQDGSKPRVVYDDAGMWLAGSSWRQDVYINASCRPLTWS